MTDKQREMFRNRKERYIRSIVKHLQYIAKTKHVREDTFDQLRQDITSLEDLHSDLGQRWLGAKEKFEKYYDIDAFLESENPCTKEHLTRVLAGQRSWSPRLKECVLNYMKKVTV